MYIPKSSKQSIVYYVDYACLLCKTIFFIGREPKLIMKQFPFPKKAIVINKVAVQICASCDTHCQIIHGCSMQPSCVQPP